MVKQESSFFSPPADMMNGLCAAQSKVERKIADSLVKDGPYGHEGPADWAGIDRQYFVVALVPKEFEAASCKMTAEDRRKHPGFSTRSAAKEFAT